MHGLLLSLAGCATLMSTLALAPVLPQLMVAFRDVPDAAYWIPAVVSVPGLGAAVAAPFVGYIGDRFGRRLPLIIFCMIFSIAGSMPIFISDFSLIFLTRIIVGVACTAMVVLSSALIGDYFSGPRRDRWIGVGVFISALSALVILPSGGWLGAWLGWRGPFVLFLSGFPLALAYWVYFRAPAAPSNGPERRAPWSALPWRWLFGFCLISICAAVLFYAMQLQIGLALSAIGVTDPARIGMLSAIAIAGIPVGAFLFLRLAGTPFLYLFSAEFLVSCLSLLTMRYVDDYRIFIFLVFLSMAAGGIMIPTLGSYITRRLEGPVRARGIGIWQSAFAIGQFLSVGVTGALVQQTGGTILDSLSALGAGAAAAMFVALGIIALRQKSRRAREPVRDGIG